MTETGGKKMISKSIFINVTLKFKYNTLYPVIVQRNYGVYVASTFVLLKVLIERVTRRFLFSVHDRSLGLLLLLYNIYSDTRLGRAAVIGTRVGWGSWVFWVM